METNLNNTSDEEVREETSEQVFDFWADEGARLFNEILDEGSAHLSTGVRRFEAFEAHFRDEGCDEVDPESYSPDEETLPPGEIELIFENSYIV